MKSRITLCLVVLIGYFVNCYGQTDMFSISKGKISVGSEYLSEYVLKEPFVPSGMKVYTYKTLNETNPSNTQQEYRISLVGTSPTMDNFFDGFRIFDANNKKIFEMWGYSPLRNVGIITMNNDNVQPYVVVPLDEESFALIFGGITFDSDDTAPEMLIVVINKDNAKVVFDRPALAYSYTASPNFSIEFVDEMGWIQNEFGNDETPTAEPLASRTKHKIWREGNMLKYKSWK